MSDIQPEEEMTNKPTSSAWLNCTSFNLRRAMRTITQIYNAALAPTQLLSTQFSILAVLITYQSCSIKKCAEELGMDPTTLSRNLQPLERRQLVVRRSDPEDQRAQVIDVTAQGWQVLREAFPYWQAAQEQIINAMQETNWQRLLQDLRFLADMKER